MGGGEFPIHQENSSGSFLPCPETGGYKTKGPSTFLQISHVCGHLAPSNHLSPLHRRPLDRRRLHRWAIPAYRATHQACPSIRARLARLRRRGPGQAASFGTTMSSDQCSPSISFMRTMWGTSASQGSSPWSVARSWSSHTSCVTLPTLRTTMRVCIGK